MQYKNKELATKVWLRKNRGRAVTVISGFALAAFWLTIVLFFYIMTI